MSEDLKEKYLEELRAREQMHQEFIDDWNRLLERQEEAQRVAKQRLLEHTEEEARAQLELLNQQFINEQIAFQQQLLEQQMLSVGANPQEISAMSQAFENLNRDNLHHEGSKNKDNNDHDYTGRSKDTEDRMHRTFDSALNLDQYWQEVAWIVEQSKSFNQQLEQEGYVYEPVEYKTAQFSQMDMFSPEYLEQLSNQPANDQAKLNQAFTESSRVDLVPSAEVNSATLENIKVLDQRDHELKSHDAYLTDAYANVDLTQKGKDYTVLLKADALLHGFQVHENKLNDGTTDIHIGMNGSHTDEKMAAFLQVATAYLQDEKGSMQLSSSNDTLINAHNSLLAMNRDDDQNLDPVKMNQTILEMQSATMQTNFVISPKEIVYQNQISDVEISIDQPIFDQVDFVMSNGIDRNDQWENLHMGVNDQTLANSRFAYEEELYSINFLAGNSKGDSVFNITNDRNGGELAQFSINANGEITEIKTALGEHERDVSDYINNKVNNFTEMAQSVPEGQRAEPDFVDSTLNEKAKKKVSEIVEDIGQNDKEVHFTVERYSDKDKSKSTDRDSADDVDQDYDDDMDR